MREQTQNPLVRVYHINKTVDKCFTDYALACSIWVVIKQGQ